MEEFWLRKKEAAANKDRGRAIYGGYVSGEILQKTHIHVDDNCVYLPERFQKEVPQ